MSFMISSGCLHPERPEKVERLALHRYRVVMRSTHKLLNNTFIGVGFDWRTAADEKPFEHLPFESFLAITVLRYEMFQYPKLEMAWIKGYIPARLTATSYAVRTERDEEYVGFLMDWKHRLSEQPVADIGLQAGLSYFLIGWLADFKEWEYAARIEREFFNERLGVPHSGDRRGGEKLPSEP